MNLQKKGMTPTQIQQDIVATIMVYPIGKLFKILTWYIM